MLNWRNFSASSSGELSNSVANFLNCSEVIKASIASWDSFGRYLLQLVADIIALLYAFTACVRFCMSPNS